MIKPNVPKNEAERQKALDEYEIVGVAEREEFDFLTQMAAEICGTKISLINFVTNSKQWFLSHHGLEFRETPREVAFCAHAILNPTEPFIIEDARKDERFHDNPLVTDEPKIAFYAGIPLVDREGYALGTICAIDTEPKRITEKQVDLLKKLSRQVVLLLELQRNSVQKKTINKKLQDTQNQLDASQISQKESFDKYSKIFQFMSEGIVIHEVGETDKIIDCNEASAHILRLTKRQLMGLDSFHPQWRAINEDGTPLDGSEHPAMITIATGKPVRNKIMGVHKNDADMVWILVSSEPIFEESTNKLKFVIVSFTEFTEIKNKKEQFELAVAGTNDGIWDWNIETGELFISKRWKKILGYEDHELKNEFQTFASLLHEEDLDRVNQYIQEYMQSKIKDYSIEFRMKHKDGSLRWILAKGEALRDKYGRPYRMAGSHSDITKRKEAELQLSTERTRLAGIIEGTNVGTWEWNVQTGETIFNERWAEIIGYTLEEISPVSIKTWERFSHPEDFIKSGDDLKKHFNDELDYYEFEARMRHKNGTWVWVLDRGQVATWTENGEPLIMLGTHQDITERKRVEEELKEAQQKAESANQAKSEFLANMSHEIRTPLNGVIGFTELLQKTKLNEIQKEYCDSANISGKALLGIINDILDFSKIEAGKLDLEIIETDVVALVQHSTDIIKYHAGQKGLELLLNIQPDLPRMAFLDPVRLNQVMVNLLSNAVKFTEKGEVEVQLTFEPLEENKGRYKFAIRDTGIGITQEQQTKLFQAFSQADGSTTRKYGGTGLGLIISNLLVEKMGSTIQVDSKWGEGSKFNFSLEMECRMTDSHDLSSLKANLPINSVLVVDDNVKNRRILEENFRYWGIQFTEADRGLSALKLMESNKYDLLIVDYHMPYMDGIEFIQKVREIEKDYIKDIPIILLHSSSDDPYLRTECKKLGVQFNLVKPIKADELYQYIRNIHNPEFFKQDLPENDKEKNIPHEDDSIPLQDKSTILIAEDVPLNLLLVKGILKRIRPGAKILEAENGRIALDIARNEKIDLILMDIQMPVMDGLEATKKIREWEADQKVSNRLPIVALTAGVVKEEQENALDSGMDEFLTKPIDQKKLKACLEKYLGSRSDWI
ncbi:MAG: response regulator [Leptospira sp.]|nr:response regulator [Leptospira sp.]